MSDSKEVVSLKDRMAADAKAVVRSERPPVSRISCDKAGMTYLETDIGKTLDAIVVANSHERTFYEDDYDPDVIVPPTCFAQSLTGDDMTPHENVPDPISGDCASCPNAQFGTAKLGKGQACKSYRKLMLIPANTDDAAVSELAMLRVPPASLKFWARYATMVASSGRPPWAVVTRIKIVPQKMAFTIEFERVGDLSEEMLEAVHGRIEECQNLLMQPYAYDVEEGADPNPIPAKGTGKTKLSK